VAPHDSRLALVGDAYLPRNQSRNSQELGLGRTDDFDAATFESGLLQLGDGLLDDRVAHLLYFGCVMFVPSNLAEGKLKDEIEIE
jgi:hypothetical protein